MQKPIHIPKTHEQYTDPRERELYDYFVKTLGWGQLISARGVFEFLIEARRFAAGKVILDAGAGLKRFEPFFDNATYLTVEHPSGIAMKDMQHLHYDFIAELDKEMFTEEKSIDAIYCHSVLEHIEHPEIFFANALRMLTPGGRLFINVPFMYLEHETPYDFNRFTRYGLRSRLEQAGFNIISLLPSTNAFYGASTFVAHAIRHEEQVRSMQLNPFDLPNGGTAPVVPFLSDLVARLNLTFDEAIYDNTSPCGWLCIAEKPTAESDSRIEVPQEHAVIITHEDDIPPALNIISNLEEHYKVFVFDPYLVDKLAIHGISNIELVTIDRIVDYPTLYKVCHSTAFEFEKELEAAAQTIIPDVSILAWQHLNLFHIFLAVRWYSSLWPEVLGRLTGRKLHVFVCDNPAQYYDASFIPSLLLMQVLASTHIGFSAYSYGKKDDYTDLTPDFFGESPEPLACDIFAHLSTCFYDFRYFNDELAASGKTVIHMRSREWSVPINAVRTIGLGKRETLADRLPAEFLEKEAAFFNCVKDKLDTLLEPYIRTQSYRNRQAAHIANVYTSQLAAYYQLEEYFTRKKPSKILLSDHDAGFHGPIVSFSEKNGIPVLLLPHSRTSGNIEFDGSNMVSLVHPVQGESVTDRNGKRILTHTLAYPESFYPTTVFPAPVKKVGLLLNTLSQNGVMFTRYGSFIAGIKKITQWCKNNGIELSIRCRPHLPLLTVLSGATGMEVGELKQAISVSLVDYAKSCDVCLMYGAPTAGALDFLKHSIPVLNVLDDDLTLHESSTINAKVIPRSSVDAALTMLDTFVSDPANLFDFRNTQFINYINLYNNAYPLRHFL